MGHIGGQMDSNCCAREIRAQSLHSKVVPCNWDFDLLPKIGYHEAKTEVIADHIDLKH